jgi:hypothetical protein
LILYCSNQEVLIYCPSHTAIVLNIHNLRISFLGLLADI